MTTRFQPFKECMNNLLITSALDIQSVNHIDQNK